jgi:uncharacterized protein
MELDDLFYYPPQSAPAGELTIGDDGFLDLGPVVRQLAVLAVPMQVYCRPDCLGLCPECGANLNEGPCNCEPDDVDPRLTGLRSLLDN